MDCSPFSLFTHQINFYIPSSYSFWNGLVICHPLICISKWSTNSLSGLQGPLKCDPSPPLQPYFHTLTLHVYCCSCTWYFLHFSHAFSFLFFSLCCYICLEYRHLPPLLYWNWVLQNIFKIVTFLQSSFFPWNPVNNQMSVIMPSFDVLGSNCCSYCTYFTQLCSIPVKCAIKSFPYCKIKAPSRSGIYLSFSFWSAVFVIGIQYTCKRMSFELKSSQEVL